MPSVRSSLRVGPLQQGSSRPLYHLDLRRGQILPPSSTVELALALLLLRHVLPGVLLDRPGKLGLIHGDLHRRVDELHLAQRICSEFLVANQHLRCLVGIIGQPCTLDAPPVHVCPLPDERVRPPVYLPTPGARPSLPSYSQPPPWWRPAERRLHLSDHELAGSYGSQTGLPSEAGRRRRLWVL